MLRDSTDGLRWPDITMVKDAIHNPDDPRHFMRIKPIAKTVRIQFGDSLIAKTQSAIRVLEAGVDLYDPVVYVPLTDMSESFDASDTKTFCPLKGDASFMSLTGRDGGEDLAWTYTDPFEFAAELKGYVAFYAHRVIIKETPI